MIGLTTTNNGDIDYFVHQRTILKKLFGHDLCFIDWDNSIRRGIFVGSSEAGENITNRTYSPQELSVVGISTLGPLTGRHELFLSFLEMLEHARTKVTNPPSVIRGNFDKQYLLDFQKQGVSTVPTISLEGFHEQENILEYLAQQDFVFEEYVLKPKRFGEKAVGTLRVSQKKEETIREYLLNRDVSDILVQPFLPEVSTFHERSLVFVDGTFSHAGLRNRGHMWNDNAGLGILPYAPRKEELELAYHALAKNFSQGLVRIDFLGNPTRPMISEYETINPNVWFAKNPEFAQAFLPKYRTHLERIIDE